MTSFEGDVPAGESVDVIAETAEVETAEVETAAVEVDAAADETAADAAQPADVEEEELDPAVALKKDLRSKPGDWYVIHSYAGYEK